jgi:hypothetical protein
VPRRHCHTHHHHLLLPQLLLLTHAATAAGCFRWLMPPPLLLLTHAATAAAAGCFRWLMLPPLLLLTHAATAAAAAQAVRALLRFYVVVVVPLFTAPYWVFLGQETRSFAFGTAFGLLVRTPSGPSHRPSHSQRLGRPTERPHQRQRWM